MMIQNLLETSNKKFIEERDLDRNDQDELNYIQDLNYNPSNFRMPLKEIDSEEKRTSVNCFAGERCNKEIKRLYGSLMKVSPPQVSPIKINPTILNKVLAFNIFSSGSKHEGSTEKKEGITPEIKQKLSQTPQISGTHTDLSKGKES